MMKNNIFWHICELNNWKNVVEDQYESLETSNIIDVVDNIYISFIGTDISNINYLQNKTSKIKIINYTTKYNEYERCCMHSLLDWAKFNESNILYIHAKGVSRPNNSNVWLWRKFLEKIVIFHHKECIAKLANYDVIGANLINAGIRHEKILNEEHCLHFSGNFWWSKTSHINNLCKIREDFIDLSINHRYWLCERWILSNYPQCKPYEICSTEHKHFYRRTPPNVIELKNE